jgi:hypothetical protein
MGYRLERTEQNKRRKGTVQIQIGRSPFFAEEHEMEKGLSTFLHSVSQVDRIIPSNPMFQQLGNLKQSHIIPYL